MCFNEGNVRSWIKKVITSKIVRLWRAHIMFLMKEMSDTGMKRFDIMCSNKGNVRSWNKKVSTVKIFRLPKYRHLKHGKTNLTYTIRIQGYLLHLENQVLLPPLLGTFYQLKLE